MLATSYQTTQHYIPQNSNIHSQYQWEHHISLCYTWGVKFEILPTPYNEICDWCREGKSHNQSWSDLYGTAMFQCEIDEADQRKHVGLHVHVFLSSYVKVKIIEVWFCLDPSHLDKEALHTNPICTRTLAQGYIPMAQSSMCNVIIFHLCTYFRYL